jgi:transposase
MLPYLLGELSRPGVTRQLLWEEYREKHPDGYSYTQFCFHLQTHTETAELSMHLEHKPGNRLFVDYAGKKPVLHDLKTRLEIPVELSVAALPASCYRR